MGGIDINRLSPSTSSKDVLNSLFSPNWRGMFIGKAGAGKTYVLRNAGPEYNIVLLGPSNLAAMVLGGKTLCSWLGGIQDTTKESLDSIDEDRIRRALISMAMDPLPKFRGVYIDEMSFFDVEVFRKVDKIFDTTNKFLVDKGYPLIHLIWGGDFLQLETIGGNPIYTSPLMENYKVTITPNVYRQKDEDWKACLSAMREGRVDEVKDYFKDPHVQATQLTTTLLKPSAMGPKGIHIVGKREDVDTYAASVCLELSTEKGTPRFSYWNGYTQRPSRQRFLHLTQGIRVKAGKKVDNKNIVKGLFGSVQECSKDRIDVVFDNGVEHTYLYNPKSQLYLEPGSVATVHSVQGLTIPSGSIALLDLMSPFTCSTKGGLYVGASRTERPQDTVIVCRSWADIKNKLLTDKGVIGKGLY